MLALAHYDGDGIPQLLHYDAGVGTRRWWCLLGGAFGVGLSRNVHNCYPFLVERYEPGDELYFFGLSRGGVHGAVFFSALKPQSFTTSFEHAIPIVMLEAATMSGTPDQLRRRLRELADNDVTELVFQPCGPDVRREPEAFMDPRRRRSRSPDEVTAVACGLGGEQGRTLMAAPP